jgi:hypothetical protein
MISQQVVFHTNVSHPMLLDHLSNDRGSGAWTACGHAAFSEHNVTTFRQKIYLTSKPQPPLQRSATGTQETSSISTISIMGVCYLGATR